MIAMASWGAFIRRASRFMAVAIGVVAAIIVCGCSTLYRQAGGDGLQASGGRSIVYRLEEVASYGVSETVRLSAEAIYGHLIEEANERNRIWARESISLSDGDENAPPLEEVLVRATIYQSDIGDIGSPRWGITVRVELLNTRSQRIKYGLLASENSQSARSPLLLHSLIERVWNSLSSI